MEPLVVIGNSCQRYRQSFKQHLEPEPLEMHFAFKPLKKHEASKPLEKHLASQLPNFFSIYTFAKFESCSTLLHRYFLEHNNLEVRQLLDPYVRGEL